MISLAYRTLVEIDSNETISGYRASINMTGQRGRPSFEIREEQLAYLLEQGFNVGDIGSILGVSIRTTDLNYWIKLLSCIIEANGGHIGLSHINLHWYY